MKVPNTHSKERDIKPDRASLEREKHRSLPQKGSLTPATRKVATAILSIDKLRLARGNKKKIAHMLNQENRHGF